MAESHAGHHNAPSTLSDSCVRSSPERTGRLYSERLFRTIDIGKNRRSSMTTEGAIVFGLDAGNSEATGVIASSANNHMSVTKIRGMASGCHLKCLHFW